MSTLSKKQSFKNVITSGWWAENPGISPTQHPFHMVTPSAWPFLLSMYTWFMLVGTVAFMHGIFMGKCLLVNGILFMTLCIFGWLIDVNYEASYQGQHTKIVQNGLKIGFALFILSEIMFFFGFFWGFFHSSLAPAIQIGAVWPPQGIETFSPWGVPLLNTFILLLSGATITWSHYSLVLAKYTESFLALFLTIILGLTFTIIQYTEYKNAGFSINDGIYGSCFFLLTGFHGFHVIVGTIMLSITLIRFWKGLLTEIRHISFEVSAWYWHFVDVVWLFLYISIYWWGR